MNDRFAGIRRQLEDPVLAGAGESAPELRQAAANQASLPEELRAVVDKIHQHAYRITDEEVAALRNTYSDDQLLEVFAAAAVGAARLRLEKALQVVAMMEGKRAAAAG
jgi:hypothetical protein